MSKPFSVNFCVKLALALTLAGTLAACASGPQPPKPAELGPNPNLLGVRLAWKAQVGKVDFPLTLSASGNSVTLASSDGVVTSLDAQNGSLLWRVNTKTQLSAGVGSDGHYSAVVTLDNQLLTLTASGELWRTHLPSQVFTAPLVAGERVFVLMANRSVLAFDARSGAKLWASQPSDDALVLRHAGVLQALGNTLVLGLNGRLLGLDPLNASVLWDTPLVLPRATNDIERLVDVVSGVARVDQVLCVRAFQAAVGCVNGAQGTPLWVHAANGFSGLSSDGNLLYGVEQDGKLMAWRLTNGELAWSSERLRYRQLGQPLVLGRSVVVGDSTGLLHFLARSDGTVLTRLATDGSAIAATPLPVGNTLVAVTRNGAVFGFVPQ